jgi:predicted SprT family Zn-dependent metalloprotease
MSTERRGPDRTDIVSLVRPWATAWGMPGMEEAVRIRFSRRMTRDLGRSWPERGEIAIKHALLTASDVELHSVICHEVAHIAAFHLYGKRVPPHGDEWAELVRIAGHIPAAHVKVRKVPSTGNEIAASSLRRPRELVTHICPVCQTERRARRVISAWRCAECIAAGLDGKLQIRRRQTAASV